MKTENCCAAPPLAEGAAAKQPSGADRTARGASKYLAGLPSRGLFSSAVLSSNPVLVICRVACGFTCVIMRPRHQMMTVEMLRALLKERGLSPKGKKDELIARLKDKA
ncbi:hypothetical protein GW17_00026284 [Ensete ventricosum]|nr:hypothetical protein GW17_00026284 [Ensete ventricosum]RZS00857.1 hypothetical protein BHM03_00030637 [Ensete ventricosum]